MQPSSKKVKNQAPAKHTAKARLAKESKEKGEKKCKVRDPEVNNSPLRPQASEWKCRHSINLEHENQSLSQTGQTPLPCECTAFPGLLAGKLQQSLWGFVLCLIFHLERKLASFSEQYSLRSRK